MDGPSKPYDINFCFPVPETLESKRVALQPFVPSKHAKLLVDQALLYPDIYRYLPFGPFQDVDDFLTNLIEARVSKNSGYIMFAIYDKTRPAASTEHLGAFAGLIGLINSSASHLFTEIGFVMILPPFQRTHVASNAVGILLHFALDTPNYCSDQLGGPANSSLGLRRVVWQANALNAASVRLAERMGFSKEAVLRWDRVLPLGKGEAGNGIEIREGDPCKGCVGRDTALLSLCWDDWEKQARERVNEIMKRVR
ncbi:acyl-CoA N-acyltransferase [Pholiota molesta]|nr:acyl-CoA N-acyltransferase [Pholiota molesta]